MKKWTPLILIAFLISAACGQTEQVAVSPEPADTVAVEAEATETTVEDRPTTSDEIPTEVIPTATEAVVAEPSPSPVTEATVAVSDEPTKPSTEEPVQVNGVYEETFFRGAADAPVTLIDYSDFL